MVIDIGFNIGDEVCYLSGDDIYYSTINKITIEWSFTDRSFLMVYKLADGLSVPRNNYPKWDKRLFKNKKDLIEYLTDKDNYETKINEDLYRESTKFGMPVEIINKIDTTCVSKNKY